MGYAKAPVEYESRLFVQKELDILGSRNATPSDFASVLAHLERDLFPIERVITQVLPFDAAGQGLALWDRDPAAVSKMIVEVGR